MNKLLSIARGEIGYLEKASAKDLDSKSGNAGSQNITKYWRDLYPAYQGQPWCDAFVGWCFRQAFGQDADALLCGGLLSFYTPESADRFKRAGRWSSDPAVGAQIFFKNSERIYHTGIVEAYTDTEVTTIEGNTDTGPGVVANGGGVWRKTYRRTDPKIAGYGVPGFERGSKVIYTTPTKFITAVRSVYLASKTYSYGDSHALPPTADHFISCDRLVAKACWDLGWRDQPAGGITVLNMEQYLLKWGWMKIASAKKLVKGDVVLMKRNGTAKPDASWHTFVLTEYDPATGICSKYDEGSNDRIRAAQPFKGVPLNEWVGARTFYCGFRCPQKPKKEKYTVTLESWHEGTKSKSVLLAQEILKAKGYKGKDGKVLKLDGEAGANTIYALRKFKKDSGMKVSGACKKATWRRLLGLTIK